MSINPFHKETPEETERAIERYKYEKEQQAISKETHKRVLEGKEAELKTYKEKKAEKERVQKLDEDLQKYRPRSKKRRLLDAGLRSAEAIIRERAKQRQQARKSPNYQSRALKPDRMYLSEREPRRARKRSRNPYPNLFPD